jgi:hypothetical protein
VVTSDGEERPFRHRTHISYYSDAELEKCLKLADELMAVERLLPDELWHHLETWRGDMRVYQEDRQRDTSGRRRM